MVRRFLLAFLGVMFIFGIFNYDILASKVLKLVPDKVDAYLAEKFLPDNFWLHMVNSVGKHKEFSAKYKGLEFDVIFHDASSVFENSHDADNLNKFNLKEQFKVYEELGNENGIWLDFKNLNNKNESKALMVLDNLCDTYKLKKDKIWVESPNWRSLRRFKEAGYKTSYYFPYYKFSELSDGHISNIRLETEMIASSGNVDAVSFDCMYYDFINSLTLPTDIKLLSWVGGDKKWSEVLLLKKYAALRNDARLQVLLIEDFGSYHR